jgi:hypothetical protein
MAYRPYIWRKNNPEKRLEQKRREKVRKALRDKGIFPPVGEPLNEHQKEIDTQISNNDFSYWDNIKTLKTRSGGKEKQIHIQIKSPEYIIWYRSKENSKDRGLDFNLDVDDIIIPKYCPLLGIELVLGIENYKSPNYYSIDRIDSSKGYVKDNIQIISRLANTMKNNATKEQLITFSKNVLKLYKS